ncbi:lipid A deacylase LpxR family protein [Solimonas terrae]|uniref:Lipid A deacylase LpxR family protein n=1 Tax=Solimonas terrae TaxID=1396819 RepID=A0A6M2BT71_9GAMM|nr:lipid A deacylase LpxR family protein [Solimonas terrae]NGY05219.1 lipid A deacylase LpxR family protein [Solimonas terrae]
MDMRIPAVFDAPGRMDRSRSAAAPRVAVFAALLLALPTGPASAAAPPGAPVDAWGNEREDAGWTFYFDNDSLTPVQRDEDYTGGIAVTLAGRRAQRNWLSADAPLGLLDALFLPAAVDIGFQLHSQQFGGLAFTPGTIKEADVRAGDRPYASLLYVANGRSYIGDGSGPVYHSSLSIGVLGLHVVPEFQDAFHSMIGARKPRGWDHQISSGGEPTFRYTLTRQDLQLAGASIDHTHYEFKSAVAASIGYLTEGSAALSWRWGRINTPWWAGPPDRVEYIAEPAPATGGSMLHPDVRELYVWGGIKAHARLYNSFLQGQFRGSDLEYSYHEVRPLIGEAWLGVTAQITGEYRLSWVMRYQTSELKPEPGDRSLIWGGLVLSHDL